MKKPDLVNQLANRINQPHVIESWINKIEKAAYKKGYKDSETGKELTLQSLIQDLKGLHSKELKDGYIHNIDFYGNYVKLSDIQILIEKYEG